MRKYLGIFIVTGFLAISFIACDDKIDALVEELELSRALSPHSLEALIRNRTTIELNWKVRDGVDHYIVQFSEDSLEFNDIIRELTVLPSEIPIQETFFGDTRYSARIKAVADGVADSKWTAITIRTDPENIFLPFMPSEDAGITEATLKWPAGQHVTRFVINPGNIQRNISSGEVAAGEATITDLDYDTDYAVTMYAGNSQRGSITFRTLMDPDCPTCVKLNPGQDISDAIDAAAEGSIIVLTPGTYPDEDQISITKSITIQGAVYYDKPLVYGQLSCGTTVGSIAVKSVIFSSDPGNVKGQFFNATSTCNLTSLVLEDVEIRDYSNSFISSTSTSAVFGSITITDAYVHSIPGGGGDGIDVRGGTIGSLTVSNSTFANGFRSFLRMQASCVSSFKNCTFYKVCGLDNSNNTGLFRSSGGGTLEVSSCLFVETGVENPTAVQAGNFCRNAGNMTATPTYSNNNIHGCMNLLVGLYTSASEISATELNPGFVDAPNGDFTVTNQTLIDRQVGDKRWLK